jgi:hypothetical protein
MKRVFYFLVFAAMFGGCGNASSNRQQGSAEVSQQQDGEKTPAAVIVEHQRWEGRLPDEDIMVGEGDERFQIVVGVMDIRFTRYGDVFRGELLDPGFQELVTVPIFGTISKEGEVKGYGAVSNESAMGNSLGFLRGKITGDVFHVAWMPFYGGEYREMDLHPAGDAAWEAEAGKHPAAFYNSFFTEDSRESPKVRVFPFVPEKPVSREREYGYHLGEHSNGSIILRPTAKAGEVSFTLFVDEGGRCDLQTTINGTAPLDGNRFRYRDTDLGYEFEVAIYTDFVHIRTLSGTMATCSDGDDTVEQNADGIYTAALEMVFYQN